MQKRCTKFQTEPTKKSKIILLAILSKLSRILMKENLQNHRRISMLLV